MNDKHASPSDVLQKGLLVKLAFSPQQLEAYSSCLPTSEARRGKHTIVKIDISKALQLYRSKGSNDILVFDEFINKKMK